MSDEERMTMCLDDQNSLYADAVIRHSDGQLVYFLACIERGEERNEPHLQITYQIKVNIAGDTSSKKQLSASEKTWLKSVLAENSTDSSPRVCFKTVKIDR